MCRRPAASRTTPLVPELPSEIGLPQSPSVCGNRFPLPVQSISSISWVGSMSHITASIRCTHVRISAAFGLRFRRKTHDRIPPHLPDDPDRCSSVGKMRLLRVEPGIDQQTRVLDVPSDRVDQLSRHPQLAALAPFLDQPRANRRRQRRPEAYPHHQGQRYPALAVQEGR